MAQTPEVPVFLTGFVRPSQIDICMDGANYLLQMICPPVLVRLKAMNEEAERQLEVASHLTVAYTVAGYRRDGINPVCSYVDVYAAWPAAELADKLAAA